MPRRPVKRITFTVEQWPANFRVRAALYEADDLIAAASRTIPMIASRAETADAAELMPILDQIVGELLAYVRTDPLPFG